MKIDQVDYLIRQLYNMPMLPKSVMILSSLSLTLILLSQICANVDLLRSSSNLFCALSILLTSVYFYTPSAQLLSANEDHRQLVNQYLAVLLFSLSLQSSL